MQTDFDVRKRRHTSLSISFVSLLYPFSSPLPPSFSFSLCIYMRRVCVYLHLYMWLSYIHTYTNADILLFFYKDKKWYFVVKSKWICRGSRDLKRIHVTVIWKFYNYYKIAFSVHQTKFSIPHRHHHHCSKQFGTFTMRQVQW